MLVPIVFGILVIGTFISVFRGWKFVSPIPIITVATVAVLSNVMNLNNKFIGIVVVVMFISLGIMCISSRAWWAKTKPIKN
jgi:hypothetical protein